MKKLLFLKLLKDFFKIFLVVGFSLVMIVWIIQAVNYLKFVTDDGHSFYIYFSYTFLNFPKIVHRMLPTVFFLTLFYQLIQYEVKNELLVFWSHGVSKLNFINIVVAYSVIILVIQIILSSLISPLSQNKARTFLRDSNVDFFPSLITEGKFINIVSNLTILIDSRNEDGMFKNIYIKDGNTMEKGLSNIIWAKTGYLINEGNKKYLQLHDGKYFNNTRGKIRNFNFETIEFDLTKYSSKTITETKIQEVTSLFLFKCFYSLKKDINYYKDNKIFLCNSDSFKDVKEEFLKRFYKPFYIPLLGLIIALVILKTKEHSNYNFYKILLFLIAFITIIISEVSLRYAAINLIGALIFIFMPLVSFALIYILFMLNLKKI